MKSYYTALLYNNYATIIDLVHGHIAISTNCTCSILHVGVCSLSHLTRTHAVNVTSIYMYTSICHALDWIGKSPKSTRLPKKANWENCHISSIVHDLFYTRFEFWGPIPGLSCGLNILKRCSQQLHHNSIIITSSVGQIVMIRTQNVMKNLLYLSSLMKRKSLCLL